MISLNKGSALTAMDIRDSVAKRSASEDKQKMKNRHTSSRRRSDEVAILTTCVQALQNILLSIKPIHESAEYMITRARLLSTAAMLRQYELQFEEEDLPPPPQQGEAGERS